MSNTPVSAKYKDICPDTVSRLYAEELSKRKSAREAEKALKTALHQITGAFMTGDELKRARKLLAGADADAALFETLKLHASTRERLEHIDAFYDTLLSPIAPKTLLDLACGLNPLYLGHRGYAVRGLDVSGGCVQLINDWALRRGWDVSAQCRDLLCAPALPETDAALMMKLLPVLEQQKKGAAMELLTSIPAPVLIVTFPLKTLGGRSVGMEKHYSDWFEQSAAQAFNIERRDVLFGELCYTVRRKAGD